METLVYKLCTVILHNSWTSLYNDSWMNGLMLRFFLLQIKVEKRPHCTASGSFCTFQKIPGSSWDKLIGSKSFTRALPVIKLVLIYDYSVSCSIKMGESLHQEKKFLADKPKTGSDWIQKHWERKKGQLSCFDWKPEKIFHRSFLSKSNKFKDFHT